MLTTKQLEMFTKKLNKELEPDKYWTKETIIGLLEQLIDLSKKFDEREQERNGTNH